MKSVGEIMSIGRSFEEMHPEGSPYDWSGHARFRRQRPHLKFTITWMRNFANPTDLRIFAIAQALEEGYTIERIEELTKIDPWFIEQHEAHIVDYKHKLF